VTDLRDQLQALAARGEVRGADAVLAAAVRDAQRGVTANGNGQGGAAPLATMDEGDDAVVGLRQPRRNRSPWRTVVAASGVAALLGVTFVAISAIGNRGGASSPEAAVRDLAKAIDAEDPLAAVDVIAPEEVRSLRSTVDAASHKAQEVKLVEQASAPFAGVDVRIDDLQLASEQLADGYVKVHLTNGTISARVHRDQVSPFVRKVDTGGSGERSYSADFDTARPFDTDPFVVAIRRNGSWYVSAAYTTLEYVRAANHLPVADYGSGLTANLGAATPDAAAREFVDALAAKQWDKVFALLPPDETPLYDYRAGLAQLLNDQHWNFTVTSVDVTAETHGDTATLQVSAKGTFPTSEGQGTWTTADDCIRPHYPGDSESMAGLITGYCLSDRGVLPFWFSLPSENGPATVQAVERDGRWFLSPVATSLQTLDAWVSNFDERTLHSIINDYADLRPDGALTFGKPTSVHSDGWGLAYAYTFEGTAGQQVIGTNDEQTRGFGSALGVLAVLGPDGRPLDDPWGLFDGYPVTLPKTGTYKLVVQPWATIDATFTMWDANDAPASVTQCNRSTSSDGSTSVLCGTNGGGVFNENGAHAATSTGTSTGILGSSGGTAANGPTPTSVARSSDTTAP
jgi:hypothetical protein